VTRYELLDRIGVGGMAEIFRGKAVAAGGFEKPVAIKRILPHLSQDKRFVELLIAEAKVLSLLKHRNIVQIFDVGLGDDGQYFLVMEYVDGNDLGAVQRGLEAGRRRVPFDLALHIVAEICEALEHAHSARAPDGKSMSLVHRDVSPSNVLLSRAGELKLTDFGIAKRAEQEPTGHGGVRGKFAYISPEQARNEHLDPRSDVFSVGILLWELVTGRRLFSALGDLEALRAVREAEVPRPREIDGRLSPEIDALIMSALAREARGRPTAGQFGAQLRSLRYSLEVTVGDPAAELAKILDSAAGTAGRGAPTLATPPSRVEFEGTEATVIRIHTADEFSMREDGTGMARARQVIDRFEEEETRQAQLSRDQLAFLRKHGARDSGEMTSMAEPPLPGVAPRRVTDDRTSMVEPPLPGGRARRPTDEPTRAHEPLRDGAPVFLPEGLDASNPFDADATQLRPPPNLRTPPPERMSERSAPRRPPTQPPPVPGAPSPRLRPPTPPPPDLAMQGTVHDRLGRGMSTNPPPAAMQPMPMPPTPGMQPMPMPPAQMQPPNARMMQMQPPQMQPPQMQPPQMQPPQMQPPGYPNWGRPPMEPPSAMYERPVGQRPVLPGAEPARPRRPTVKPWMLVIGALLMAFLAFAVTRACIHTAATKPAVDAR
jgi:hypothetical protein